MHFSHPALLSRPDAEVHGELGAGQDGVHGVMHIHHVRRLRLALEEFALQVRVEAGLIQEGVEPS